MFLYFRSKKGIQVFSLGLFTNGYCIRKNITSPFENDTSTQNWLYLRNDGFIWAKLVVVGQNWLCLGKLVVFGQKV